jgi:hypothetical protein
MNLASDIVLRRAPISSINADRRRNIGTRNADLARE